ncbi:MULTISPECIES: SDR family oxidoreductase [unclassified Francisella]|uniref:SDR family oxidoreductase n=1 Tax=unclassified Francisella TaxID=2610885 RepID=UPI002E347EB0|nr:MULTISPECIES: SDR family oxidoreductase [unclassified Francisella]MED7818793.1 SDR family oxidoreductase [Francisella sp. 19S2-4]MED7829629.1 SDR family oxidoreductase [Francisella sp. 19S2-10]
MNLLKDKHILIVGASSGMGKAIAELCLTKQMKISLCSRRKANITGDNVFYQYVDIQQLDSVESFVTKAIATFGEFDYIVNCAGVMYYQCIENRNYEEWMKTINTNVIGFTNLLYSVLPSLIKNKGMLINITSDAARQAFPGLAIYSGSKAFMEYTLRAVRQELMGKDVRVINIQPGNVATPLQNMSSDKDAVRKYASNDTQFFITPQQIAETIVFAMNQPKNVALNEILIEPQKEPISG